ncbi:MAG: hypothetical protein IJB65_03400 [Clostridia bacterium]|nr:hypothetical protein [Clostridia bacterium]
MKKQRKDIIGLSFLYCAVTFVANFIASAVALGCVEKLVLLLVNSTELSAKWLNTVSMLALSVLNIAIVIGLTALFVRVVLPPFYKEDCGKLWLKSSAFIILPGETLRLLYSLWDLGFVDGSGRLSVVPSCLFELLYLNNADRHLAIRQYGEYAFADYAVYSLCYFLYLAVLLTGIFWVCRAVWNKYGKDYEDI